MASSSRWQAKDTEVHVLPAVASHHIAQLAVSTLRRKGFRHCEAGALALLNGRLEEYLGDLISSAQDLAELGGRTRADVRDFMELFDGPMGGDTEEESAVETEVQFARIPELRRLMKRDRKRSKAGKNQPPPRLSLQTTCSSPILSPMLALPTDDLPESLRTKVAELEDHVGWLPEIPPRHTWMRTYLSEEQVAESSKQGQGGVKVEDPPAPAPVSVMQTGGNTANQDHIIPSSENPARPTPSQPPPPPKITIKVQRTSHLSQQSVKYLVSTLAESSNIPLELGIINHRQNPLALKRRIGVGENGGEKGGLGDEVGRYDIFGEMGKKRKVVLKKNNDGTWIVPT